MTDREVNIDMYMALAMIFLDEEIGDRARKIAAVATSGLNPVGFRDLGGGLFQVTGVRPGRNFKVPIQVHGSDDAD